MLGQSLCDLGGDQPPSLVHQADRAEDLCVHHLLQQVPPYPRFQRPVDLMVTVVTREGNDSSIGELLADGACRSDPIHPRHPQVH